MRKISASLFLLLSLFWGHDSGAAVNDLLKLEAVPSPRAKSSLLLDITAAGNRLVAVGERGHIIYSDDAGESWNQAKAPVMVTLTAVDFPTPEKGWAVGHDGIVLHTADGGRNWTKQLDGNDANKLLLASAERDLQQKKEKLLAAGKSPAEVEAETEDQRWVVHSAEIALQEGAWKPFMDVEFEDENSGFIIGAYGMIFRTEDGGQHWIPWTDRVPNPDQLHLNAFGRTKSGIFMVGEAGTVYRSMDRGLHWESVSSPYQGSFFGVITDKNSDTVIILGLRGNAFFSCDFGNTWEKIDIKADTALNGGYLSPDGSVIILSDYVYLSSGLGEGFTQVDLPYSVYSSITRADNNNMIVVGAGGVHKLSIPPDNNPSYAKKIP